MTIDNLLSRLDKVKAGSNGRYMACCPAHDDQSPSLVISEADDGKILLHCYAGCTAQEVVYSLGLTLKDLFPDTGNDHPNVLPDWKRERYEKALFSQKVIVSMSENLTSQGHQLSPNDQHAYDLAKSRIRKLEGVLNATSR